MASPFGVPETNGGVDSTVVLMAAIALALAALVAFSTGNPTLGVILLIVAIGALVYYIYRKRGG